MDQFIIQGGNRLEGIIKINGAKNSALPILVGSLLTKEMVILSNVPCVKDVQVMNKLIQNCGAATQFKKNKIYIKSNFLKKTELPKILVSQISSSFLLVGALLSSFSKVTIPYPGGCKIGKRELDIHFKGLESLGVKIYTKHDLIIAEANNGLIGTNINLKFPSVGATHHMIIAACLANGETTINNAAKEPEVTDLANFLNSMGADIKGAGKSIIRINGVNKLGGTTYSIMPDRICTGTYMVAAAITEGDVQLINTDSSISKSVAEKLQEIGVEVIETSNDIRVISSGEILPVEVITDVYPGFPTDMQPIITTLLAIAKGESIVLENIFNKRFNHIPELKKMGADIKIEENIAIINGVDRLIGGQVTAYDLRGGASLILAGLNAKGKTVVNNAYQIDRGYEDITNVLRSIGANIERRFEAEGISLNPIDGFTNSNLKYY